MKLADIKRTELIRSGKANDVWATNFPGYLEIEATDRISAGNGAKTGVVPGKGVANNTISNAIFLKVEERGIPTHYVGPGSNEASRIVKKAEPILLEVIARFYTNGSYCKRYNVEPDVPFDGVFVEFTYKCDKSDDPPICDDAIIAMKLLTAREIGYVKYITEQVALITRDFFAECNGNLIDFKIEFGRLSNGSIVLIDEISADTCRILDKTTGEALDKDRFRKDMGKVAEAYYEMAKRVKESNS